MFLTEKYNKGTSYIRCLINWKSENKVSGSGWDSNGIMLFFDRRKDRFDG